MHDLPAERGAPPTLWGVLGRYVFVAVGDGTAQAIVEALDDPGADAPEWLRTLKKRLQVKRTGAVRYLDAARQVAANTGNGRLVSWPLCRDKARHKAVAVGARARLDAGDAGGDDKGFDKDYDKDYDNA